MPLSYTEAEVYVRLKRSAGILMLNVLTACTVAFTRATQT